jgi:hypothetical protein
MSVFSTMMLIHECMTFSLLLFLFEFYTKGVMCVYFVVSGFLFHIVYTVSLHSFEIVCGISNVHLMSMP